MGLNKTPWSNDPWITVKCRYPFKRCDWAWIKGWNVKKEGRGALPSSTHCRSKRGGCTQQVVHMFKVWSYMSSLSLLDSASPQCDSNASRGSASLVRLGFQDTSTLHPGFSLTPLPSIQKKIWPSFKPRGCRLEFSLGPTPLQLQWG